MHHVIVSSDETIGAFNTGFDTVNLHRPASSTMRFPSWSKSAPRLMSSSSCFFNLFWSLVLVSSPRYSSTLAISFPARISARAVK